MSEDSPEYKVGVAAHGSAICDCCGKTSARMAIIQSETLAGVAMCRECALENAVKAARELLPSNWKEHSGFLCELGTKIQAALNWPNDDGRLREEWASRGLTLATLCDLILGEDAADRSDAALVRAVSELARAKPPIEKGQL